MQNRRRFIRLASCAGVAFVAAREASAQAALPPVAETDPQAVALGYVTDSAKANKQKYPKHTPDQHCGNCQLFQGKPTDATGPCPLFAGKAVANKGWCSAWVKKPG